MTSKEVMDGLIYDLLPRAASAGFGLAERHHSGERRAGSSGQPKTKTKFGRTVAITG
jgi:hypothetical protein